MRLHLFELCVFKIGDGITISVPVTLVEADGGEVVVWCCKNAVGGGVVGVLAGHLPYRRR